MSSFMANSHIYNVVTENELAEILSHYNSEFIYSVVDEAMKSRFLSVPIVSPANVVGCWEQNFKSIISIYGNSESIQRVREETYIEIIKSICNEFDLEFDTSSDLDLFSAAFHLYDIFVKDFSSNMITFFANYIYRERASLYESLGLADLKKNKDSSTIYGKKIFKDIKLAVINANIDAVIEEVCSMDIPFTTIIGIICGDNSELKRYILSIVSSNSDFFKSSYVAVINSSIRPEIITAIRFKIQEIAIAHDQTVSPSDIEVMATGGETPNTDNE